MICKSIQYGEQSHQKSKYSYQCHNIMKDININTNLLHDNLPCSYVSINSSEIHKKIL